MGHGLATMHEIDTVYGLEDVYDLLEIIAVDAENKARARAAAKEDGR